MASLLRRRPFPRRAIVGAAALACLAMLALGLGACGGGDDQTESAYRVPSLTLGDLHRCKTGPGADGASLRRDQGAVRAPGSLARQDPDRIRGPSARGAQAASRGAIFAVEGGPGYASSWTVRSYVKLFGGLLERRELVMVDHARHRPLQAARLSRYPVRAGAVLDRVPQCAQELGPRFSSYRTSAAADDINDVRRALGLGRITLYGDSYGTYLAQSYAFRHPETLKALVLDSAYPVRGESAWYPSLIATGVRSLCDRLQALARLLRERAASGW